MAPTPSDIEDQFEEAAWTLRRLPNPPGSGPKGYGSGWPEFVQDAKHAYGSEDAIMRVVPSARDIARMEEAIGWLSLVRPEEAKIIWLKAEGMKWRGICIRMGVVRQTAWRRWVAALLTVSRKLQAQERAKTGVRVSGTPRASGGAPREPPG